MTPAPAGMMSQYTVQRGNNFPFAKTAERPAEQFNVSDRTDDVTVHNGKRKQFPPSMG